MAKLLDRWLLRHDRKQSLLRFSVSPERMAEARWRAINKESRNSPCQCGKPVEVCTKDYSNTGSVPVEFWTCRGCAGCKGWQNGAPFYE